MAASGRRARASGFIFRFVVNPICARSWLQWLASDSRRVAALPVIDGKDLAVSRMDRGLADARGRLRHSRCRRRAERFSPSVCWFRAWALTTKRFRLGYGGGYYDRTLAALIPFPLVVGIAFEAARLQTIDPQPHDVKMDVVITDAAVY